MTEQHYTAIVSAPQSEYRAYIKAESIDDARKKLEAEGKVRDLETRTPRYGHTLVMGNFRWGSGVDLASAKAEFRKQGGRLKDGYAVIVFDADTDFCGVDGMGSYRYQGNAPEVTYIDAKKG